MGPNWKEVGLELPSSVGRGMCSFPFFKKKEQILFLILLGPSSAAHIIASPDTWLFK